MCSTSPLPRVAPLAIGPNIAAVPETSCLQFQQTWRLNLLMRSRIDNSTISGSAAPLSTDCVLWIFLCLALALAGLFSVGVSCTTIFKQTTPTLVSFLLRPSNPRIPTSTEAQAYWMASSCALAVPTRTLLTGSNLDSSQRHFFESSPCGSQLPSSLCSVQHAFRACQPNPQRIRFFPDTGLHSMVLHFLWGSGGESGVCVWGVFREICLLTTPVLFMFLAQLMYTSPLFVQPAHLKQPGFAGSTEPHVQFQGRIVSVVLGTWCRIRCFRCLGLSLL